MSPESDNTKLVIDFGINFCCAKRDNKFPCRRESHKTNLNIFNFEVLKGGNMNSIVRDFPWPFSAQSSHVSLEVFLGQKVADG